MREFMDYILQAFSRASGGNRDNSYSDLNETANKLLNFPTPRGLRLTLSSLATPNFATSYHLGTIGVVDGSISYLYSTVPLTNTVVQSDRIPLPELLRSYRQLTELTASSPTLLPNSPLVDFFKPAASIPPHIDVAATPTAGGGDAPRYHQPLPGAHNHTLMYGRLYLPKSMLEALIAKRLTPNLGVQLVAVSQEKIRHGGTLLGLLEYSEPRFGIEGLASTDGGLLGLRGVYNFGGDVSPSPFSSPAPAPSTSSLTSALDDGAPTGTGEGERDKERIYGRFSAGGEVYYGTLNKSGGMSVGARFQTLPTHRGTPLTATLTINPLMGNISTSYAVVARSYCTLATRMEFNVYSYESDWAVGMELWSKKRSLIASENGETERNTNQQTLTAVESKRPKWNERSFQARMEWRLDDAPETSEAAGDQPSVTEKADGVNKEEYLGVLKARLDQHLRIGLLWEGRVKSLLFSLGTGIDLRRLDQPFRTLGLEVQFSS